MHNDKARAMVFFNIIFPPLIIIFQPTRFQVRDFFNYIYYGVAFSSIFILERGCYTYIKYPLKSLYKFFKCPFYFRKFNKMRNLGN